MHAWLIAALVVSWVLVFALVGAVYVLIKQHGELMIYQQDLDHRLEVSSFVEGKRAGREDAQPAGAEMEGLPVGSEAPAFTAKDLEGSERTLADYRGESFVLAFFSDTCGYCKDLAPEIGSLPAGARKLVLLSHGDLQNHKDMPLQNNWQGVDVLIDPE